MGTGHAVMETPPRPSPGRPLDGLPLPSRVRSVLLANGIVSVEALLERSPEELRELHWFGVYAMRATREALAAAGLRLRDDLGQPVEAYDPKDPPLVRMTDQINALSRRVTKMDLQLQQVCEASGALELDALRTDVAAFREQMHGMRQIMLATAKQMAQFGQAVMGLLSSQQP